VQWRTEISERGQVASGNAARITSARASMTVTRGEMRLHQVKHCEGETLPSRRISRPHGKREVGCVRLSVVLAVRWATLHPQPFISRSVKG
jgi:hypothetical protein